MKKVILTICAMMILSGCQSSRGFDRASMYGEFKTGPIGKASIDLADANGTPREITDSDIAKVMALKPQMKVPFKLGVYFVPERSTQYWRGTTSAPKWDANDRDISWLEPLRAEGVVAQVIPVSDFAAAGMSSDGAVPSLRYIRLAAARYGADAVMVIDNVASVDRYFNPASVAYLTIVGMFFVDGSNSDALVIVNGAVFDVANEYLYCTAEGEGIVRRKGPQTMYDYETVKAAREEALINFKAEALIHLRRTK
jgi:rhombotail lipoprotein